MPKSAGRTTRRAVKGSPKVPPNEPKVQEPPPGSALDWEHVKDSLFENVDDPQKSRWWETAWELLHDPSLGPVICPDTPPIEVALWLLALRNIHAIYESQLWGDSYDFSFLDGWDTTGLPQETLVCYLVAQRKLSRKIQPFDAENMSHYELLVGALHKECFKRLHRVYKLLSKGVDNSDLIMLFLGGKIPRDRDKYFRIATFVDNGLSF